MKHSVLNRLIIGKTIGFVIGGLVFFLLPLFDIALDLKFGLGLWLLYITLGAFTALFGIMDHHPILHFKMPFWFRGPMAGITLHALFVLFAYDQIESVLANLDLWGMNCPWWALADGALLGLLMGWAETKWAGEGNLPLK